MRENEDGSVDVWFRGWKFTYPASGGKPEFSREAEAPGDAHAVVRSVTYSESELRRGNWVVFLEEQGPVAVAVKRRSPGTFLHFFRAARRR